MKAETLRPYVSIIMPSLNVGEYIEEAIESVAKQDLENIEIICVDAGSTDGTREIIERYAQKDKRIKVVISEKRSYGYQMNVGISMAKGEYVGIVETDDFIPPNMMSELYEVAKENDVDLVKADFYRFKHEDGKLQLDYNKLSDRDELYNRVVVPREELTAFSLIMNTWSGIYKKEFLDRCGIQHNETPGASFQDTGFWFQTLMWADKAYFVNKPYYMNRRDNPNSSVYNKKKIYCPCDEYDFIYEKLEENPEIKEKVLSAYQYYRYKGYMASLNRSAVDLKKEFLNRFSDDFWASKEKGELDTELFTRGGLKTINSIMENPENYFYNHYSHEIKSEKPNVSIRLKNIVYRFFGCIERATRYFTKHGFRKTLKKIKTKL